MRLVHDASIASQLVYLGTRSLLFSAVLSSHVMGDIVVIRFYRSTATGPTTAKT